MTVYICGEASSQYPGSLVMDIIQSLEARGCHHLLCFIFSRLSSPELSAAALVSRRWSALVQDLVWASQGVRGRVLTNKQRGTATSVKHRLARSEALDVYIT